jgi:serine/threonine protein kinase
VSFSVSSREERVAAHASFLGFEEPIEGRTGFTRVLATRSCAGYYRVRIEHNDQSNFLENHFNMASPRDRSATTGRLTKIGKYEIGQTLGEGTFGKVKYATHEETREAVAIKVGKSRQEPC